MPSTIHAAWMHTSDLDSGSHLFIWAEDIEFAARITPGRTASGESHPHAGQPTHKAPQGSASRATALPSETQTTTQVTARRGEGSVRVRAAKIPSHPEQVPIGTLRALLNELAPTLCSETLQPANATVWLPTVDGAPAFRRSLIHTAQPAGKAGAQDGNGIKAEGPVLAQWQVTGVQLEPLPGLLFLAHLSHESLRQQAVERPGLHRLRLGNDLIFWSNAAKFALEVLVGQHYLPSLRAEASGRLLTAWQPFLLDPWIAERRSALARSMPPICRAYNLADPEAALAPVALTEAFVATVVDAAVRAWARHTAPALPSGLPDPARLANTWLVALLAEQPALGLPPQPAHELYQGWSQWVEQLYIVRDANFRICFVLEDPTDPALSSVLDSATDSALDIALDTATNSAAASDLSGEAVVAATRHNGADAAGCAGNGADSAADSAAGSSVTSGLDSAGLQWPLRFYLQARDNPSLMIGAAEVWQAANQTLRVGNRHIDQPQERLLAGLGVAGRLFPPIARSLRRPRPEQCLLSTQEAYSFLRELSPLLESSGFGVVLPNWWHTERRVRLGLRLSFSTDEPEDLYDEPKGLPGDDAGYDWADALHRRQTDADGALSRPGGAASGEGPGKPVEYTPGGSQLGLNSLVNYSWELTLGQDDLTTAEFERLTAARTPLLRLRGRWVELDPEQVEATRRFLAGRTTQGKTSLLQAIRVAQSLVDDARALELHERQAEATGELVGEAARVPITGSDLDLFADERSERGDDENGLVGGLTVDSVVIHGWLERVLSQLRTHEPPKPIAAPEGFKGQLRPYQERGVGWLDHLCRLGLGGCLADDMGLGKTIQAIALILHAQLEAKAVGQVLPPTLLICPTSVVANWRREIERFAPGLRAMVHHGNNRTSGSEFFETLAQHDLVVTSYGTARRDIEMLQQIEWQDLILDEAQNIKTPSAKQTQAVRRLRGRNRIALTGTPVENRLSELWSIMEFLNPGYLGSHEGFRRRYIIPIERYNDSVQTGELRRLVQPFLLRRLKSDPTIISDLPEKNEMVVYCSLTREQAQLYEKVVSDALDNLGRADGIQRRGLVLALLTKLKQITNHPAHFLKQAKPLEGRSGKLNRLTEMLDEALSVGDRALIFTQFVEMGLLLQRHLVDSLGTDTLFLHGGTPANQRDKMVQAFQSEEGPPVFVLSLRAGGSGLNLTQANHVFHYDRWWNPAVENQATDRAFRIGQRRDVQVHKFVVAGTLEERIHDLIENKQALAQSIVGSGEDWLTELETDELRDLLMLRQDAIEDD